MEAIQPPADGPYAVFSWYFIVLLANIRRLRGRQLFWATTKIQFSLLRIGGSEINHEYKLFATICTVQWLVLANAGRLIYWKHYLVLFPFYCTPCLFSIPAPRPIARCLLYFAFRVLEHIAEAVTLLS